MNALRSTLLAAALSVAGAAPAATPGESLLGPGEAYVDTLVDVGVLLELAEQGDARAAFLLGTRYASGRGGVRDDSEAVRWFRRAADLGLGEAQYNLGVMYAHGRGVERDPYEAARWFRVAAENGVAEAQYNLGTFYGLGIGVPRDERLAAEWLRRAADARLPEAQYNLGVLYEHGRGVRLDARAALVWYQRAAEAGYRPARERLASLMERLRVSEVPGFVYRRPGEEPGAAAGETRKAASPAAAAEAAGAPAGGPAAPAPVPPAAVHGEEWVAALDPDHYTVQVLSDTNEESVRRFIRRHFPSGEAGYFASERDGKRWYSVLWGDFPSKRAAREAAARLPPKLRTGKPWIRPVRLIQKQMVR